MEQAAGDRGGVAHARTAAAAATGGAILIQSAVSCQLVLFPFIFAVVLSCVTCSALSVVDEPGIQCSQLLLLLTAGYE